MLQALNGLILRKLKSKRSPLTMLQYCAIIESGRCLAEHSGLIKGEMNKAPLPQKDGNLRAEKDIRLRIDLLEGQSSSLAKMLAKAIREHNEAAFAEYAGRLAANHAESKSCCGF